MFFAVVDKVSVVHISPVMLYAQNFLDVMVESVRVHQRGHLRDLTTQTKPNLAEVVNKPIYKPRNPRIGKRLIDYLF